MGKRFSVGMENESDSGGSEEDVTLTRKLVPEGDQILIIKSFKLVTADDSGSGKPYFKWFLESKIETIPIETITTLIKGKRWLLKQLLSACGIEAKEDDPDKKYNFYEEDVIDKEVMANIKHNLDNSFIGNKGNKITIPKAEIKQFKKIEAKTSGNNKTSNKNLSTGKIDDEEIPF